jgi:hypothetical protein
VSERETTEKYGSRRFGMAGPRHCRHHVFGTYEKRTWTVTTDFNGAVTESSPSVDSWEVEDRTYG